MNQLSTLYLTLFAASWAAGLYGLSSLLTGRFKPVNIKQAAFYVCTLAVLGPVAELVIGTFYHWLFGRPLWNYTIFPIHDAYTSRYAPVIWGLYGLYLYLFHGTPGRQKSPYQRYRPIMFSLEAMLVEGIANLTFRLTSGHYLYYYFPADLWHLTSVQTLPFSFAGKYFIDAVLVTFRKRRRIVVAASLSVIGVLILFG